MGETGVKWEKRNDGVCDLELGKYHFRWCLPEKTVRYMGGMMVAADVATEEQATDAPRGGALGCSKLRSIFAPLRASTPWRRRCG